MSSNNKPESKIGAMAQQASANAGGADSETRRRSSSGAFTGLTSMKRGSHDAGHEARKASFAEQTKPPGFLGGLWNSFTKGQK